MVRSQDDYIDSAEKKLNVGKSHLLIVKRGRSGGTRSYLLISVSCTFYLQYESPEFDGNGHLKKDRMSTGLGNQ